jgi:flagellin-like protein
MNKKGVSPLIATVLLIGFAIALAAVVMNWGLGFMQETTESTEKQTQSALVCASDLQFSIEDVDCVNDIITVETRSKVKVKSFTFRITNDVEVFSIDTDADLGEGVTGTFDVVDFNISAGTGKNLTSASKIEAFATVYMEDVGEENIPCLTNVQDYLPAC